MASPASSADDAPPRGGDDARLALARFELLLQRSERLRSARLSLDELRELAALYRRHSARLARLRDRAADPDAIRHLNALCVRAYGFLYGAAAEDGPPARGAERGRRLARLLAESGRHQLLAALLLLGGALLGGALTARDPDALYAFVSGTHGYGPEMVDRLWASPEARREFLARNPADEGLNAIFGSFLFANNTRVGLLALATGILAGIPTVLLLLYNGLSIGAFCAVFLRGGERLLFASWILPHGVPELTAIVLCSAAGLVLGEAVAAPRGRPRGDALREVAPRALVLFGVAVPLLLAAAVVESFVRESALGTAPRLAVAAGFAVLLGAGGVAVARIAGRAPVDTSWLRRSGD